MRTSKNSLLKWVWFSVKNWMLMIATGLGFQIPRPATWSFFHFPIGLASLVPPYWYRCQFRAAYLLSILQCIIVRRPRWMFHGLPSCHWRNFQYTSCHPSTLVHPTHPFYSCSSCQHRTCHRASSNFHTHWSHSVWIIPRSSCHQQMSVSHCPPSCHPHRVLRSVHHLATTQHLFHAAYRRPIHPRSMLHWSASRFHVPRLCHWPTGPRRCHHRHAPTYPIR